MKKLYNVSRTQYFIGSNAPNHSQELAQSENIADLTEQLKTAAAHLPSGETYNILTDAVYNEETGEITEAVTELVTEIYQGDIINDIAGGWFSVVDSGSASIMYFPPQTKVSLPTNGVQTFKGSLNLICEKLNEIL